MLGKNLHGEILEPGAQQKESAAIWTPGKTFGDALHVQGRQGQKK